MLQSVSRITGRRRVIIPIPLLSPRLSSHWLRLVTDVDLTTARGLVDSMVKETVVDAHRIESLLGQLPMSFETAAAAALAARAERLGRTAERS